MTEVEPLRGIAETDIGRQMMALVNYEAEQALLAGLLTRNELVDRVDQIVTARDFADPLHGRIYDAIRELRRQGHRANFLTLKARFDADPALEKAGGATYLAQLEGAMVSLLSIADYAWSIRDLAIRRECVQLAHELAADATNAEKPIDALASAAGAKLRQMVAGEKLALNNGMVAEQVVEELQRPPRRHATGLPRLDKAMGGGLYAGRLYGLAARKKVGKTVLLGTVSCNLNYAGVRHGFITLEMGPVQVEQRNMARILDVNAMRFLFRDDDRLIERAAQYATTVPRNVIYEHAPGLSLDELERMVMRLISRDGIAGFLLDYWQLVGGKPKDQTEEYHLRCVAQGMANICAREGIWGVIAAQINQEGNTRGGEGLRLAADMYLALHREKDAEMAWCEMQESRYTPYRDIGSEQAPDIIFHKNGPWFEDPGEPVPVHPLS